MRMMNEKQILSFRRNLRKIERAVSNRLKNEGKCCGVTFNECHILLELFDAGSVSVNDLSETLGIDKSIISKTIENLFTEQLITREEDKTDRRKKIISLSSQGNKKVTYINNIMNTEYKQKLDMLGKNNFPGFLESVEYVAEIFEKWDKSFASDECGEDQNECNCN